MAINVSLKLGTRVRLDGDVVGVTLGDRNGCVIRPDLYDGYYVVRLDSPAVYHHADGTVEEIQELVESIDNLSIPDPAG